MSRTRKFGNNHQNPIMKAQPKTTRIARAIRQATLAICTLLLGACSTTGQLPKGGSNTVERHGQVQFSGGGEPIVGDIAVQHDETHFRAEITKGPGVPLLKLYARFGLDPKLKESGKRHLRVVTATGPLAHGGWTWRPRDLAKTTASDKLKDPSHVWAALPEVFMWGEAEARGESFRVCLPDVVMHARAREGRLERFDYKRLENPNKVASISDIPPKERKKLHVLETVVCHLD